MKSTIQRLSIKGIELLGTLVHGVLVLILFWVAIDVVQQHIATGPQRPGFVGVAMAPLKTEPVQVAQVQSRTHDYGYFKALEQKKQAPVVVANAPQAPQTPKSSTPKVYTKVPMVRVVEPKSPVYQVKEQLPANCRPEHRSSTPWAPWCQTGAKSL
jgi:hypothetical protein